MNALRLFCAMEFVGAIASFSFMGAPCEYLYGRACNDAETVFQNYDALWKLHVAVLFSSLVYLEAPRPDQTHSLLMLASVCALASFVGTSMFGASMLHGSMTNGFHSAAMLSSFGILMMLLHSLVITPFNVKTMSAAAATSSTSVFSSGAKTYLFVVASYFVFWLFKNSDGSVCTEVIVKEEDFSGSPLAIALWNWWSMGSLQNALILLWVVYCGDGRQEKATCYALAFLQVPAMILVYWLRPITTGIIYIMTTSSFFLMMVFGMWAATQATKNKQV